MTVSKGEKTRKKLYETAIRLFAQQGLKATTINNIVTEAGFTQAVFYLYFKSKDQLINEIMTNFKDQLQALSNASAKLNLPSQQLTTEMPTTYTKIFDFLSTHSEELKIVLQHEKGKEVRNCLVKIIARNLTSHQQNDVIREDIDIDLLSESIVATMERLTFRYALTNEKSTHILGQQVASMFLYGIVSESLPD